MSQLVRESLMKIGIPGAFQAIYQGTVQNVSIGASSVQSTAVGEGTKVVRLVATSACYVLVGDNPTVSASNGTYLAAGQPELVGIKPGQKVAVIQASSGGSLNMTEGA